MKTAIIICSRLNSSRVPGKALKKVNGIPLLVHLIRRLEPTSIPIILAVPEVDRDKYEEALKGYLNRACYLYVGFADDPLARMARAAQNFGVEHIVRVSHDKIFVDPNMVLQLLDEYHRRAFDYAYSSKFIEGTGFEIISRGALEAAAGRYKNIEHISYAVRSVTQNVCNYHPAIPIAGCRPRLLVDYPADLNLLEVILQAQGNDCTLQQAAHFCAANPWVLKINQLPKLTVYTCAYNADKYIERAMGSVSAQAGFKNFEYIIVDDFSSDRTTQLVAKFCTLYPNTRWIRNPQNLGLASSSNVALKAARGEYIMRLDADDYLPQKTALAEMLQEIDTTGKDAIYPNNWYGSLQRVQHGKDNHHVGGAIFRTRAINHIKFTDGLRGYEGLDFWERARGQINVGYLNRPIFFYRQRPDSMSKTNLEERARLREAILAQATGGPLITAADIDSAVKDLDQYAKT